jgi:hypothetical protein
MPDATQGPSLTEEQVKSKKTEMKKGEDGTALYHSSLDDGEIEIFERILSEDAWVRLRIGSEQKIGKIIKTKEWGQGYPKGAVLFSYGESYQLLNSIITEEVEYWDAIARKWRQIIYRS